MASPRQILKEALGHTQLWRLARFFNRHQVTILMYHGLTQDDQPGDWVHVRESEFEHQMAYLRRQCNPVSLATMLEMFEQNDVVPNSVVVTFDDGYQSIASLAEPILQRHEIPFTLFLTSGFIAESDDTRSYLWTDRVQMLIQSGRAQACDLSRFSLPSVTLGGNSEAIRSMTGLIERLKQIDNDTRIDVIDYLEQSLAADANADRFEHCLPMTWDEVRALAANRLTSLGAHTCSHPILSRLDIDHARLEIIQCSAEIEALVNTKILFFAYPNGRMADIGDDATKIAAGHYRCALTTCHGLAGTDDPLWSLPRIGIGRQTSMSIYKQLVAGLF